jgi:hypothetical protein
MYMPWQEMSIVETQRAYKAIRNASDSVAKHKKQTPTLCGAVLQTTRETQRMKTLLN